jgi:hypothetical protein
MSWCIITEWEDGTVAVTGPYDTEDAAKTDLPNVVKVLVEWPDDPEPEPVEYNEARTHARIGVDSMDSTDAYVQEMGKPTPKGGGYVNTKGLPPAAGVPCSTCSANPHMPGCPEASRG